MTSTGQFGDFAKRRGTFHSDSLGPETLTTLIGDISKIKPVVGPEVETHTIYGSACASLSGDVELPTIDELFDATNGEQGFSVRSYPR